MTTLAKSKLKILHVIPSVSARRGGPSKAVTDMVGALRQYGVDAEIATTNDDGPSTLNVPLGELVEHDGVPVRFFKRFSPPIGPIREFAYSRNFAQWLNAHIRDYDVVHVHAIFSYCSTKAMQLARRHKVPYVAHPIGQLENWPLTQSQMRKQLYLKLIEQRNLTQASWVHFTAKSEQKQALANIPIKVSYVVPLGIELPEIIHNASSKNARALATKT